MPKPNKYAHLDEQARQREAKLKAAYEEAREFGTIPKPAKMNQKSSCGAPLPTVQEWVRPGSKTDKLRNKQRRRLDRNAAKQNEQRLLSQHEKRQRAQAAKQASEAYKLRGERIYDECLDAVEQEDIQAAREEINRDRR